MFGNTYNSIKLIQLKIKYNSFTMRRVISQISTCKTNARNFATIVNQYESALRYTFGRQRTTPLQPGIQFYIPIIQRIECVDCRTRLLNMNKQEILTNDNIKVTSDAIVQFRIADVEKYINNISDRFVHRHELIIKRAEVELREIVSSYTLEQLLSAKAIINKMLIENIQHSLLILSPIIEQCCLMSQIRKYRQLVTLIM